MEELKGKYNPFLNICKKGFIKQEKVKASFFSSYRPAFYTFYSAGLYLFKLNNGSTRTMLKFCSKLALKTPKPCHKRQSGAFIVNIEQILHTTLVFSLLTLNKQMAAGKLGLCSESTKGLRICH